MLVNNVSLLFISTVRQQPLGLKIHTCLGYTVAFDTEKHYHYIYNIKYFTDPWLRGSNILNVTLQFAFLRCTVDRFTATYILILCKFNYQNKQ